MDDNDSSLPGRIAFESRNVNHRGRVAQGELEADKIVVTLKKPPRQQIQMVRSEEVVPSDSASLPEDWKRPSRL